jgi:pyruvate formate lyase activating enzyme
VHDRDGDTTTCPSCGEDVLVRDWYEILASNLRGGACGSCGATIPGRFGDKVGNFGRRRVRLAVGA